MKTISLQYIILFLLALCEIKANGQASVLSHVRSNLYYVGWDNTGTNGTLDIRNDFSSPIDFYVNSSKFLQVLTSGDLNTVIATNGYMINNYYVLRHNGNPSDIFVGVGAGNGSMSGHSNTLVGNSAGSSITSGQYNTAFGFEAFKSATTKSTNTAIGYKALTSLSTNGFPAASSNTAVGFESLFNHNAYGACAFGYNTAHENTTGCAVIAVGENALYANTIGNVNTAIGYNAMNANTALCHNIAIGAYSLAALSYGGTGSADDTTYNVALGNYSLGFTNPTAPGNGKENTAIGAKAGLINRTGYNNSFLGYEADICPSCTSTTFSNSTAVGSRATLRGGNQLILGGNTDGTNYNEVQVGIGLSDDAALGGPQSPLEINSNTTTTAYQSTGTTGSGLQFRQMHSGTTLTGANYIAPYGRVLTVDANGKVVFTDQERFFGYGNCDAGNPYSLTFDLGMDLRKYNIYFDGQDYTGVAFQMKDAIGLGYGCNASLPAKLSVDQTYTSTSVDVPTIAGYFHNGDETTDGVSFAKRGILGICDGYSYGSDETGIANVGGEFVAQNSDDLNVGVRGRTGIYALDRTYGQYAFGGFFESKNSSVQNIGVYGYTDATGSTTNYGVYGRTFSNVCGAGSCTSAAALFDGDVYLTSGTYWPSDNVLKSNVQPLNNSVDVIKSLAPKTYTYNHIPNLNLPIGSQSGLIAQDVQSVLPQLISHFKIPAVPDSTGHIDTTGTGATYLAINYVGLIPYLVGAIKEQQVSIDSLHNQLNNLQDQINNCCASSSHLKMSNPAIDVELTNSIILNQNDPNPFAEETKITYSIPGSVSEAKIIFFDNSGHIIQTVKINERGSGQLNVYASNLTSGMYSYSLIADGKVIDTKKMILSK